METKSSKMMATNFKGVIVENEGYFDLVTYNPKNSKTLASFINRQVAEFKGKKVKVRISVEIGEI